MARAREILFRIFYSTSFTIVFLVLIAFICISPADSIYQSYKRRRLIDIFLIAGVYVVTALIAILIYASRLYTTRSVLRDIPKTFLPLDQDELPGKRTWRLISETIKRSAIITHQTRPRARRIEYEADGAEGRIEKLLRPETRKNDENTKIITRWGPISHAGWSSPANTDLPDLQYEPIVRELTDLIEARAVSLAPIDPLATPAADGHPVPDARVVDALTRPNAAGMRQYISQLMNVEVLESNDLTTSFLTLYERARFAEEPLSESEFKNLMRMFAEVLRNMKQVNVDLLDLDTYGEDGNEDESTVEKKSLMSLRSSTASSIRGSIRHYPVEIRRSSLDSGRAVSIGEG